MQRVHAGADHQRQLGDDAAVEVERCAGVGAGGDGDAGAQGEPERLEVTLAQRQRLLHCELGDAGGETALDDRVRRDERGHERRALRGHARGERLGEKHAMLDGVDARVEAPRDPLLRHRVGRRAPARAVRLVDARAQLVERQLRRAWIDPGRHDAAGGHELDDVGARTQLLAHGAAQVVGTVGLPAEQPPAVAARDADGASGAENARPRNHARAHGIAHGELGVLAAAEVAHGGHAGLHRAAGAHHRAHDRRGVRLVRQCARGIGFTGQAQVDVTVDQTGQQRQAAEIEHDLVVGPAIGHDGGDASLVDDHGAIAEGRRTAAVDQRRAAQDHTRPLRYERFAAILASRSVRMSQPSTS